MSAWLVSPVAEWVGGWEAGGWMGSGHAVISMAM